MEHNILILVSIVLHAVFLLTIIIVGIVMIIVGYKEKINIFKILGLLYGLFGLIMLLLCYIPTRNYTEWSITTSKTNIVKIEDQYIIEKENSYVYRAVSYSNSGIQGTMDLEIEKNEINLVI